MSICATVKTQKLYYLSNMRSTYFAINRRLHRERERGHVHLRNMQTQKWYYVCNTRYAYFPIDRRLHRERESLCPSVKWQKHRNGTMSVI